MNLKAKIEKWIAPISFFKQVAKIAIPVYLSSILLVMVNIIDSTMIAPLGTDKLASVNAAGEINFLAIVAIMGVLHVGFIYFTQYHGKKVDSYEVKAALTTTSYIALIWAGIIVLFVQFFSENLVGLFLKGEENIKTSASYLRIVSFSWLFSALITTIVWALSRIGKAFHAVIITIVSLCLNVTLNYLFINGIEVPKLGVDGVAISTLLSRVAELGVAVTVLLIFGIKEFKGFLLPKYFSLDIIKRMLSKSLGFFNEILWSLSLVFQFWLTTQRGDNAAAVIGSAHVIVQILFAAHSGFASVTGYLVGRELGANNLKQAVENCRKLIRVVVFISIIYSLLFASISFGIVKAFDVKSSPTLSKEEFEATLLYVILGLSVMYTIFSTELVLFQALVAGGKVWQAFVGDVLTNWLINSVGAAATFLTNMDYLTIYLILIGSDCFKLFVQAYYFERYDWVRSLVKDNSNEKNLSNKLNFLKRKILLFGGKTS